MNIFQAIKRLTVALAMGLPLIANAEFKVMVGIDPADEDNWQMLAAAPSPTPSLSVALGSAVRLRQSANLVDVTRALRLQENDILIGPSHLIASAISHDYQLLARDSKNAQFVLVVRRGVELVEQAVGIRLYLTQQDSFKAYLAKWLLTEAGFDISAFKQTVFGKTSDVGLSALALDLVDVTIAEKKEAQAWIKTNPGVARILKSTRKIPAGVAVMVRKSMSKGDRHNLVKWINSPNAVQSGFGKLQVTTAVDEEQYRYIASLGTPNSVSLDDVTGLEQMRPKNCWRPAQLPSINGSRKRIDKST